MAVPVPPDSSAPSSGLSSSSGGGGSSWEVELVRLVSVLARGQVDVGAGVLGRRIWSRMSQKPRCTASEPAK